MQPQKMQSHIKSEQKPFKRAAFNDMTNILIKIEGTEFGSNNTIKQYINTYIHHCLNEKMVRPEEIKSKLYQFRVQIPKDLLNSLNEVLP